MNNNNDNNNNNNSAPKKRRLELMPEVLPKPERIAGRADPRSRILARVKYLAALSATGIAAACTGGGGSVDGDGGGPIGGSDGGRDGFVGGEDAYGVVDPLPSPSCFRDQALPEVSANYTDSLGGSDGGADAGSADAGDGSRVVEIDLFFDHETDVTFSSTATSTNGTIERSNVSGSTAKILLRVSKGQVDASVRLPYSCPSERPGSLFLQLKLLTTGVSISVSDN